MGQQHFYISDELEALIARKAQAANLSVSKFLARLVQRELAAEAWPPGYFDDVFGAWAGEPLTRASQPPLEKREKLR